MRSPIRRRATIGLLTATLLVVPLLGAPAGAMESPATAGLAPADGAAPHAKACDTSGTGAFAALPQMQVGDVPTLLQDLHAIYADLPGFLDVYYYQGASPAFRPMFAEAIPEQAYARVTPVPVAFDLLPEMPVALPGEEAMPLGGGSPDLEDITCPGIRPGARISSSGSLCSLNFIFTDGTHTYAGTAGHCVGQGASVSITNVGVIGTAVFRVNGGVGNDFALIRIHDNMLSQVNPEMCDWGGPDSAHDGSNIGGLPVLQTGQPLGINLPPRPRPGVGLGIGANSFTWMGTSLPGDSGSGARLAMGGALGTVTHLSLPIATINFGTTLQRGLNLASNAGFDVELVTVDSVLPV